jgi:ABC-type sugar transport system ATPase subunit
MNSLLCMQNIKKAFPGVQALSNVSLEILPGEVHALIGENGAGKSTLMKILSGVYQKDSGEIFWDGQSVDIDSTSKATELGIGIIYQELNQLPNLSVAENIFIGREKRKHGIFLDMERTIEEAHRLAKNVGLDLDVRTLCRDLSIAQRQMVEVAKALSVKARLIIMDEPTSSLTEHEIKLLFDLIIKLKEQNVAVVFISHKLDEIFEVSDRITVLRDGECVGTINTEGCTEEMLIQMMVGRSLTDFFPKKEVPIGDVAMKVENLNAGNQVQDVSFEVRSGEILGFSGLVGAGRSETMRAIFGVDPMESGTIMVGDHQLTHHSPSDAIRCGIGLVPEDRKLQGLILQMTVRENTTLANMKETLENKLISTQKEAEITQHYVEKLDIRTPSIEQKVENLSGGNQQKVVISKWLATGSRVLILDSPTRGIDVGAKKEIHELIGELTSQGVAIIMVSSELPEILGMCDRVLVMHEGRIQGELSRQEATQEKIMEIIFASKRQTDRTKSVEKGGVS